MNATTAGRSATGLQPQHSMAIWLLLCCAMVYAMVVLGGVTRLTGSGLSMVQWNPIFGILPPLSDAEWQTVFDQYRQSPEYLKINRGMDLQGFKGIYWFEYSHRLLGRAIGLAFLLPLLYFLFRGYVSRRLRPRLIALFLLGGLQGLLGWYMVKSGLVDNPHVSQYRLTAHLGLAVLIYGWMLHIALNLLLGGNNRLQAGPGQRRMITVLIAAVFLTMLSGGLTAGLKAGHAYNTFPLMDGHLVPEAIFMLDPLWRNFLENIATVQFDHRLLATLVFVSITVFYMTSVHKVSNRGLRTGLHWLMAVVSLQVALGISTLLLHVPVALAATHQAGALLLFTVLLYLGQGVARGGNYTE